MELQKKELLNALSDNNFSIALARAKELEELYPKSSEIKILYGDVFMKMSNYLMASEQYENAMRINPLDPNVYSKLGVTCTQLDKWEQAISYFKSALSIAPDDHQYHGFYGWAIWTYGKIKNDKNLLKEAYKFLSEAKSQGIEMDIVNDALAEYHIDNATSSWPIVHEKEGPVSYATKLDHLIEAKKELDHASRLMSAFNTGLKDKYHEVQRFIADLEKRDFHGYPFVRKAAIIGGALFLLFGSTFYGMTLLIMAALYHHAQMTPGYVANRIHVKGNFGDPFWVRRINEVGRYASSFTFYSTSFSQVLFMGWIFRVATLTLQYTMAIFLLPFLIISGYISNYDLLSRMKQLAAEGVPATKF